MIDMYKMSSGTYDEQVVSDVITEAEEGQKTKYQRELLLTAERFQQDLA